MDQNKFSSSSKQLTYDKHQAILQALLEHYKEGKLECGAIKKIADSFNVNRNCISQVWKCANESIETGSTVMDIQLHKTDCGCKKKEIDMDQVFYRSTQINSLILENNIFIK